MSIPNRVLTTEALIKERVQNKTAIVSGLYPGKIGDDGGLNLINDKSGPIRTNKYELESAVVAKSGRWVNSAGYYDLWNKIEAQFKKCKKLNISQFPDEYYTLIDMIRLDLTRRRLDSMDLTSRVSQEVVNNNFGRSVKIDEFIPFAGAFLRRSGRGEGVPMIEQKTGVTGHVDMYLYSIGHERSLEDELYNLDIFTLQKVMAAVNRAFVAGRNFLTIGQYVAYSVAGTWAANQMIAANTNANYEMALYLTLHAAYRRLVSLIDPQTLQEIGIPRTALIVRNNAIVWDLNRILSGQLNAASAGDGNIIVNRAPLPIDEIWQYKGDTLYAKGKKIDYPGVPENTAYLVVIGGDNAFYTLVKRGLTMEMGRGDVLTLAREKRAWYFVQGGYSKEHFGETGGCAAGSGFCVTIGLPVYEEET